MTEIDPPDASTTGTPPSDTATSTDNDAPDIQTTTLFSDLLLLPQADQVDCILSAFGMTDEGIEFVTTSGFLKQITFEKFRRKNVYDIIKKLDAAMSSEKTPGTAEAKLGISLDDLLVFRSVQL